MKQSIIQIMLVFLTISCQIPHNQGTSKELASYESKPKNNTLIGEWCLINTDKDHTRMVGITIFIFRTIGFEYEVWTTDTKLSNEKATSVNCRNIQKQKKVDNGTYETDGFSKLLLKSIPAFENTNYKIELTHSTLNLLPELLPSSYFLFKRM